MSVMNRKMFAKGGGVSASRKKLRQMGGIMASSEELMREGYADGGYVKGYAPGGSIQTDPGIYGPIMNGARIEHVAGHPYILMPDNRVLDAKTMQPVGDHIAMAVRWKVNPPRKGFDERVPTAARQTPQALQGAALLGEGVDPIDTTRQSPVRPQTPEDDLLGEMLSSSARAADEKRREEVARMMEINDPIESRGVYDPARMMEINDPIDSHRTQKDGIDRSSWKAKNPTSIAEGLEWASGKIDAAAEGAYDVMEGVFGPPGGTVHDRISVLEAQLAQENLSENERRALESALAKEKNRLANYENLTGDTQLEEIGDVLIEGGADALRAAGDAAAVVSPELAENLYETADWRESDPEYQARKNEKEALEREMAARQQMQESLEEADNNRGGKLYTATGEEIPLGDAEPDGKGKGGTGKGGTGKGGTGKGGTVSVGGGSLEDVYNKRYALISKILGDKADNRAKDTGMKLLQIGLAIAGGQSPFPITNIAQGALSGFTAWAKDIKESRAEERALKLSVLDMVLSERAAAMKRAAASGRGQGFDMKDLVDIWTKAKHAMGGKLADIMGADKLGEVDFKSTEYANSVLRAITGIINPASHNPGQVNYKAHHAELSNVPEEVLGWNIEEGGQIYQYVRYKGGWTLKPPGS